MHKDLNNLDRRIINIPFKYAHRLFEKYKVTLKGGFAQVGPEDAFIIINELFNEILFTHGKNIGKIYSPIIKADERIEGLIESLQNYNKSSEHFFKSEVRTPNTQVSLQNMDNLVKKHFPLCMSEIMGGLKRKHMLKHWGRLQLGMFLKGIGLKLEDNILLFSNELQKTAIGAKKVSEYKYYIEHMYGKRGKKTDYTPWSCQKVANKSIPGKGENYGCPYKYYSDSNLRSILLQKNLKQHEIAEVLGLRA